MDNKKFIVATLLVALVALGVAILKGNTETVIERIERITREIPALGGTTNYDSLSLSETLNVTGTTTLTDLFLGGSSGLDTIVKAGTCADATTTLAVIPNAFAATSTVDLAQVNITGVSTSSIQIYVATSTSLYAPTLTFGGSCVASMGNALCSSVATTTSLINAAPVLSSTTPYIVNGMTLGGGGNSAGLGLPTATSSGGTSQSRITVSPNENILVWAEPYWNTSGSVAGLTSGNNVFACTYKVRFTR